jgi:hypothetical protein
MATVFKASGRQESTTPHPDLPEYGVQLLLHELAVSAPAREVIVVHRDDVPEVWLAPEAVTQP